MRAKFVWDATSEFRSQGYVTTQVVSTFLRLHKSELSEALEAQVLPWK